MDKMKHPQDNHRKILRGSLKNSPSIINPDHYRKKVIGKKPYCIKEKPSQEGGTELRNQGGYLAKLASCRNGDKPQLTNDTFGNFSLVLTTQVVT